MIVCVTLPMAALERPANARAAVPFEAPAALTQASSPIAMISSTTEAAGAAVAARGEAIRARQARESRTKGVTVFGVPGGLHATRGTTPKVGTTERTVATLVRAYRRTLALEQRRLAAERKLARKRAAALERRKADPEGAICMVFGSRCREALRVAHCESRFDTGARNGQYLGLFQMGSWERATYGHGATPFAQATAAYRYFVASGRDWSPWSCKPWY